jgi:hypothetical protein
LVWLAFAWGDLLKASVTAAGLRSGIRFGKNSTVLGGKQQDSCGPSRLNGAIENGMDDGAAVAGSKVAAKSSPSKTIGQKNDC